MYRLRYSMLLACLLMGLPGASAETPPGGEQAPASARGDPVFAVVLGLSGEDLLNIRRDASPLGRTLGRLPNGALVNRGACKTVEGYDWCHVETVDGDRLAGWAPARYLFVEADEEAQTGATASADTTGSEPPASQIADEAAGSESGMSGEDGLPPGIEARFASGDARPIAEIQRPEPELLALAGEPASTPRGTAPAGSEPGSSGMPVPTPRPDRIGDVSTIPAGPKVAAALPADSVIVAPAPNVTDMAARSHRSDAPAEAGPGHNRTGTFASIMARPSVDTGAEIPCARYVGQPMGRCAIRVARGGRDTADVTVTWPDGGNRTIAYRDGLPASVNTRGDLRVEREGTLSMIRVGAGERFEILDELVFED